MYDEVWYHCFIVAKQLCNDFYGYEVSYSKDMKNTEYKRAFTRF